MKTVAYLQRHSLETLDNKRLAKILIEKWNSLYFDKLDDGHSDEEDIYLRSLTPKVKKRYN